jgi:hypothetical protein
MAQTLSRRESPQANPYSALLDTVVQARGNSPITRQHLGMGVTKGIVLAAGNQRRARRNLRQQRLR